MAKFITSSTSDTTLPEISDKQMVIKTPSTGYGGGTVVINDLGLPTDGILEFTVNMNMTGFYNSALNFYFGLIESQDTYDFAGTYGIPTTPTMYYIYNGYSNCYTEVADYKFVFNFSTNYIYVYKNGTQMLVGASSLSDLTGKTVSLILGIGSYIYSGLATINSIQVKHNDVLLIENVLDIAKFLIKKEDKYYTILDTSYDTVTKQYKELTITDLKTDIETYGFAVNELVSEITIDTETFKPIDKFDNFSLVSSVEKPFEVKGLKSNKELIVSNQNLSTVTASTIHNFVLDVTKTVNGNIKFVISDDNGLTWKTWNGTSWNTLTNTCPLTDDNKVKQYSKLSDSEKNKWNQLKEEIWTSGIETDTADVDYNLLGKNIRFAFVLYRPSYADNVTLKNLSIVFDKIGNWHKLSESDIDIAINTNSCSVTAKQSNLTNVKVNILI